MKKLFGLMAIAIVAFAFSACGSKNDSPESVVKAYLGIMQKMDFDALKDVVYFESEEDQTKLIQMWKEKAQDEEMREYMKIDSFEVGEVEMAEDGQSAKVHYVINKGEEKENGKQKVILKDGKWYISLDAF